MEYPEWYEAVYHVSQFPENEREYWERVRDYIIGRDDYRCQACRKKGKRRELTVHHIIPRAEGGNEELENLITLHYKCHDYVEAQGFRTWHEIKGSTKSMSKLELEGAQVASIDVPEREKPTQDNYPTGHEDRAEIICPCGIYHIRKASEIGNPVVTVSCVCGRTGRYLAEVWKWEEPQKLAKLKPNPEAPKKKAKVQSVYLYSTITCPVCNTKIQYHKDDLKPNQVIVCNCGTKANQSAMGFIWYVYVERSDVRENLQPRNGKSK